MPYQNNSNNMSGSVINIAVTLYTRILFTDLKSVFHWDKWGLEQVQLFSSAEKLWVVGHAGCALQMRYIRNLRNIGKLRAPIEINKVLTLNFVCLNMAKLVITEQPLAGHFVRAVLVTRPLATITGNVYQLSKLDVH